jgi:SAM-dependent methyltransferase
MKITKKAELQLTGDVRSVVRERYTSAAQGGSLCGCGSCCGGTDDVNAIALQIGYHEDDMAAIPEGANLGLGCGNPLEYAVVQPGEVVLDLGSGAGLDCFLAARALKGSGRVIGVDMTPAMIEKARANAAHFDMPNVEFRLGEIEHLPVADQSVDVIISNCVINLSPDKAQVFAEALRVLKPGGRLLVSDLVLLKPISPTLKESVEAYVGCVAGASLRQDYLNLMTAAGFEDVAVVDQHGYDVGLEMLGDELHDEAVKSVVSIKVRARKKTG